MWIRIFTVLITWTAQNAAATCFLPLGDVTQNGIVNVVDVQCSIQCVFWDPSTSAAPPDCINGAPSHADLNCDGTISVSDVVITVLHTLSAPLDAAIDTDADGCIDTCVNSRTVSASIVSTGGFPIEGATAKLSGMTTQTDVSGTAVFSNPPPGGGVLVINHPAFAPASRPIEVPVSGAVDIMVVLVPVTTHGPFTTDAPIVIDHALARVIIPAGGVVLSDGSPALNPIEVRMATIDPSTTSPNTTPGPMVGHITQGGQPQDMETLFMAEVTILSAGQPAQLAPGITATLRFPIAYTLAEALLPGDNIPAWWYDVETGVWQAEGTGALETDPALGLVWTTEVTHFTWWAGATSTVPKACLTVTVLNDTGVPVVGATVSPTSSDLKKKKGGTTDTSGTVCLSFPQNSTVTVSAYHPAFGNASQSADAVLPADGNGGCYADGTGCGNTVLTLQPKACVRGTVAWPNGTPQANQLVLGSWPLPEGGSPFTAGVKTSGDGTFCMAAQPATPTTLWSAGNSGGVISVTSAVGIPPPDNVGCAGSGCLDMGTLTLTPPTAGDPNLPAGCLCAVHGTAGSIVTCPIGVASTSQPIHRATMMSGELTFDATSVSLNQLTTILCFTTPSLPSPFCAPVSVVGTASFPLSTGHTMTAWPQLASANGELRFVLINLSKTPAMLSNAETDGQGTVTSGAPVILTIHVKLSTDVPQTEPVLLCLEKLSASDGTGRRVGAYVSGGIVTTTGPLADPAGTHVGCPVLVGDYNVSGEVNVADVKCSILNMLAAMDNSGTWPLCNTQDDPNAADVDCSGQIDLIDIYATMTVALGLPLPPTLDANGDGCIDRL